MKTEEFKIGDVVKLKSGGPPMTVTAPAEDGWRCCWHAGAGYAAHEFPAAALERVNTTRESRPLTGSYA